MLGRAELTQCGHWMAAVLACGNEAALSHVSAASLWGIRSPGDDEIHISVPDHVDRRPQNVVVHRRQRLSAGDVTRSRGIPVTTPIYTLIDLAACLEASELERVISEADKRSLTNPEALRLALEGASRRPGAAKLRKILDRHTFVLTDSALERLFGPIARKARLPRPETRCWVNGFRVDFYWPTLGLVVETDGLRYHRTAAQQTRDRIRDQAHIRAGLTPLRFTHAQVRYEPDHVLSTLRDVARNLQMQTRLC